MFHISVLGGQEGALLLMTCVMATGYLCSRRNKCNQETLVQWFCERREYCSSYISYVGQFWVQTNCNRKLQRHIHTMHSLYHCGTPATHATGWGKESQRMNGNFSQCFLQPLTFNTSVSLTTTISHKHFIVSWTCRSFWVKWEITFQSHFQTMSTTSILPTFQPMDWTASVMKVNTFSLNIFMNTFLFKGCALFFLTISLILLQGN